MVKYKVSYPYATSTPVDIQLPASKSIANRALIIAAFCNGIDEISNLSEADDTRILYQYLTNQEETYIHCGHGGTTFRFLLAYRALLGKPCTMTGSDRLIQRPVRPLVEALCALGASIDYLGEEGFPPLKIGSFEPKKTILSIPADISSQFISALLMVGPQLSDGLTLHLEGKIFSKPYIEMTLRIMEHYGARWSWEDQTIRVFHSPYQKKPYPIEADWSAASYAYTLAAFMPGRKISIPGLFQNSLQGDAALIQYGTMLGIQSSFDEDGVLHLIREKDPVSIFTADLIKEPDLSLALAVAIAGLNIKGLFNGLESLRVKETDRITALDKELSKVGFRLLELDREESEFKYELSGEFNIPETIPSFSTYHDHRMAMSMACLAVFHPVYIEDPSVVSKSFPTFWEQLSRIGFEIEIIEED
jgi:3-phosphoshikimate 1-carboxyvinyltransferase